MSSKNNFKPPKGGAKLGPGGYTEEDIAAIEEVFEKREEEKKKKPSGKVDVEPQIDRQVLSDLEREQQRERLEVIKPREPGPVTQAIQAKRQAEEAARQAEQELAIQSQIYAENVRGAEEQIAMLQESPSSYTIDGKPVKGEDIDRLKRELEEYKREYADYASSVAAQSSELRQYGKTVMGQVKDWSTRVVERNKAIAEQKGSFNRRLTESIGFGTGIETGPRETGIREGVVIQGIPGPAAGPAPGSFGAKLQEQFGIPASKLVREGIEATERPFQAVTQPARALAEKMITRATEDKSLAAVPTYLTGVGLSTAVQALDVATLQYRPGLILETAKNVGMLAFDSRTREALIETVKKDPFRFTVETVGGAALGAKLGDISRSIIKERGPVYRTLRAGGTPSQAYAVARRGTARVDFNKLLQEELAYRFPEEFIEPELFESFVPETSYMADTTFNKKFGKPSEPFVETGFGIKPTRGVYPKSGYLGFGRTGAEMVPLIIPEEYAIPTTIYKYTRSPLTIPSGRPGIPFAEITQKISKTTIPYSEIFSSTALKIKQPQVTKQRTPQVQRPATLQQNIQQFNQTFQNKIRNIPSTAPISIQNIGITQRQPQRQRQKTIQIPRLTPIQIPEQEFEEKLKTNLLLPPPRLTTKKTTIPIEKKKKTKKRKTKSVTESILEYRVDPLGILKVKK